MIFANHVMAPGMGTIAVMMKAVSLSETSVNIYQTAWRNNPGSRHLQMKQVHILPNMNSRSFFLILLQSVLERVFLAVRSTDRPTTSGL
jgi:hypothetical protein